MIVCPCGQTVETACSWPPYRVATYDEKGEVIFAICVHGVVVLDKRPDKTICCDEQMKLVDDWWVCTKCWKHWKREEKYESEKKR